MKAENLKFQSFKNLSIVQFGTENKNTFDYISLSNAIKNKHIQITEINDQGSVNELKLINESEYYVFLSDGDILTGAMQNRVLNTSVLLMPKSKSIIPVSCVEQGRWRFKTEYFSYTDYSAPSYMRSGKAYDVKENLKRKKRFHADQGKVWDDVNEYESRFNYFSKSSNLSDLYEEKREEINEFTNSLKSEKDMNGMSIFSGQQLICTEIFNRTDVYEEYFSKMIKGAWMESCKMNFDSNLLSEEEAFHITKEFLESEDQIKFEEHKGVSAGIERRFETENVTGFELCHDNKLIHFAAFNKKSNEDKIISSSRGQ